MREGKNKGGREEGKDGREEYWEENEIRWKKNGNGRRTDVIRKHIGRGGSKNRKEKERSGNEMGKGRKRERGKFCDRYEGSGRKKGNGRRAGGNIINNKRYPRKRRK